MDDCALKNLALILLPQAYPEGAPLHPSFPAAHAEVAGACVTILKAFTDPTFLVPSPLVPSSDGSKLMSYDGNLSVEGELKRGISLLVTSSS